MSCNTGTLYCYGYPPLLSGCNFTSQISCYNQTYNMTQSNIEIKPAGVSALTSSSPQIPGPIRSDCRKLRWRRLSINLFDLHQSRQTSDKLCHPGLERKTVESFSQRTSPHLTSQHNIINSYFTRHQDVLNKLSNIFNGWASTSRQTPF